MQALNPKQKDFALPETLNLTEKSLKIKPRFKHKKFLMGFTLIELLVVIAIIGLLASVVLVSLNGARIKGRDVKRVADLKQIRTALELYLSDNGQYPITNCSAGLNTYTSFDAANTWAVNGICMTVGGAIINANITAALSPYMKGASDPKRTAATDSGYLYLSNDGIDFTLMAYGTPENMNDFDKSLINYTRCGSVVNGQCTGLNTIQFSSALGEH